MFIIIIIIIVILRVFHISINWCFLTGVWVIASLLKYPGLFSVFWPILTMPSFWWSLHVLLFSSPSVSASIPWWLYQDHQLLLVSPSLLYSTVLSVTLQCRGTYPSFSFLSILLCGQLRKQSPQFSKFYFFFFFCLSLGLAFWPRFGDPFESQNPRGVSAFQFIGQIQCCWFYYYYHNESLSHLRYWSLNFFFHFLQLFRFAINCWFFSVILFTQPLRSGRIWH